MANPQFTSVAELIEKLKAFPPDMKICGHETPFHLAEKLNLFDANIKVNDDGYLEEFDVEHHDSEDATKVLMLTFDRY